MASILTGLQDGAQPRKPGSIKRPSTANGHVSAAFEQRLGVALQSANKAGVKHMPPVDRAGISPRAIGHHQPPPGSGQDLWQMSQAAQPVIQPAVPATRVRDGSASHLSALHDRAVQLPSKHATTLSGKNIAKAVLATVPHSTVSLQSHDTPLFEATSQSQQEGSAAGIARVPAGRSGVQVAGRRIKRPQGSLILKAAKSHAAHAGLGKARERSAPIVRPEVRPEMRGEASHGHKNKAAVNPAIADSSPTEGRASAYRTDPIRAFGVVMKSVVTASRSLRPVHLIEAHSVGFAPLTEESVIVSTDQRATHSARRVVRRGQKSVIAGLRVGAIGSNAMPSRLGPRTTTVSRSVRLTSGLDHRATPSAAPSPVAAASLPTSLSGAPEYVGAADVTRQATSSPTTSVVPPDKGWSETKATSTLQQLVPSIVQWALNRSSRSALQSTSILQVTLVPQHLGKLRLTMTSDKSGGLRIRMASASALASSAIQAGLGQLHDQLQRHGYSSIHIDVFTDGQSGHGTPENPNASPHSPVPVELQPLRLNESDDAAARAPVWVAYEKESGFFAQA